MKKLKFKLNMKKVNYLLISLFFVLTVVGTFFVVKNKFSKKDVLDELININELDDEFMDKYYKDSADLLDNGNRDNVLIIVSKKSLKDVYGAKRVVNAPNSTYILEYKNEKDKYEAKKKFEDDKTIYSVTENRKYTFYEESDSNDHSEKTYNSWGIEKAGLSHAIDIVNEKGGQNVTAAIIDTGCDMEVFNQSFAGKIEEVYNLHDVSTYGTDVMFDHFGHGTHIAGTIAEGTSDNVKILPIKTSDASSLDDVAIIHAINYITSNHKADVINMSFGEQLNPYVTEYDYSTDSDYIAIEAARRENIISVVAAGNDNTSAIHIPSYYDNTISISAVDQNLEKADFSNYGDTVDFAAPGVDILSINGFKSGTSMATPHAVSAVALIKSFDKDMSFQDTKETLKNYSDDLGARGKDPFFGYGFINLLNLNVCDENSTDACTDFGTNDKIEPTHIEVDEVVLTPYNYGSLTNILPTRIKLLDSNDKYEIVTLDKLDDLTISGYDPYASGEQTVSIGYLDMDVSFKVTNPVDYEIGWNYVDDYGDQSQVYLTGYKENGLRIEKLYFPKKLAGKNVVGMSDDLSYSFRNTNDVLFYKEIYLPDNYRLIRNNAFTSFRNLYKVKSDAEDINVGSFSFDSLRYLSIVDANVVLTEESFGAFSNASSLKEIRLSSKTKLIPGSAFSGCMLLYNIEIPDSVESIEDYAFYRSGIKSVSFSNNLKRIGMLSFYDSGLINVYIPKSVVSIGNQAFGGYFFSGIEVDEGNTVYDSREDCNSIIESSSNTLYIGSNTSKVPSSVKKIGEYAFYESGITNIEIPDGVEEIGDDAFHYCDFLENVKIGSSVTKFGNRAFDYAGWGTRLYGSIFSVKSMSSAHDYVNENDYIYTLYDKTPNVPGIENVSFSSGGDYEYLPYQTINLEGKKIMLKFDDSDEWETITEFKKVVYQGNRDSLRHGDYYYLLYLDSSRGYYNLNFDIDISVGQLTPEYEIPTDISGNVNSTLADVDLPDGFEWEDPSILLSETGDVVYDAKYIPSDDNYRTVEDIAISVHVVDKELIKPEITIEDKIYDGKNDISFDSIDVSGLEEDEYTIKEASIDDNNVGIKTASVKIELSSEKYSSYSFSNGKQEKVFKCSIRITPKKIKAPTAVNKTYVYNGKDQYYELDNYNNKVMRITGNKQKNVGRYNVEISLINNNYEWTFDENTSQSGGGSGQGSYVYGFDSMYSPDNVYFQFYIEKADINYYSSDRTFIYDGYKYGIDLAPRTIDTATVKYMDDHGNYTLDESPKYSEPGVYVIKYMITAGDNYKVAYGENTLTIIQDDTFVIKDNNIIIGVSDFDTVVSRLPSNSSPPDYSHYDKNEDLATYDSMKTGDIIRNSNNTVEYHVVVLGDTSGDGKVNYLDYVNIYNHIQKDKHPLSNKNKLQDVYYEAGDLNRDGSISYLDYVQLFRKINNKEGETE